MGNSPIIYGPTGNPANLQNPTAGVLKSDASGNLTSTSTTGSGNVVLATAPTLTNPVVGTQATSDNSTKAASTSYVTTAVNAAVAGINPAVAVQAATTSAGNTSTFTYNNGAAGIGATLTSNSTNTALTVDGFTFTSVGQRLLVKNDTQSPSGAFNGVYFVSILQTVAVALVFTRALDYDSPSDINNTGAIPVINGTVNGTTTWVNTATVNTVGTDPLAFTQFSFSPASALQVANNLSDVASRQTSLNNLSGAVTTAQFLRGNGTNVTMSAIQTADVPTLNQNTTGTASNITDSSNSTLTTLSALSLPGAQVTGNIAGNAANITANSNSTLTTLSALSLPGAQVTGNIAGNAANITASSNSTLTTLSALSLPGAQVTGNISGNAANITASSNSTLTTLSALSLPGTQVTGNISGNAANVTGTVAVANGGTGQTTYTDGQLLIGNTSTTGLNKSTLTAGANVTITNGNGSITVAATSPSPAALNVVSKTSNYSAVINDFIICSSTSFTVTLPTAVGQSGSQIVIQHNGTSLSQVYTLNTTSSQTINGAGGTVSSGNYALYTAGERLTLFSDGSNWQTYLHDTTSAISSSTALAVSSTSAYIFTITSATVVAGDTYTNNTQTFTVTSSGTVTSMPTSGTGAPTTSGTLTRASGTGPSTLTFSAVTTSAPAVNSSPTTNSVTWSRNGRFATIRYNIVEPNTTGAAAGNGDYIWYLPSNMTVDTSNISTYIASVGADMFIVPASFVSVLPTSGTLGTSTAATATMYGFLYSTSSFRIGATSSFSSFNTISSAFYQFTLNTGVGYNFTITVPISGWQP